MELLDLSLATQTLQDLLEESFRVSSAWSDDPPGISSEPPHAISEDALSLYLYRITENEHFKNLPPEQAERLSIQHSPMALNLHYQLSAHSTADPPTSVEQQMMGIALKALHDHPVIDDSTQINGTAILPLSLRGKQNRLEIAMEPLNRQEAFDFWTTEEEPLRLSVYYRVSVVLLEPEPIERRPARVLRYGVLPLPGRGPRLDGSQSVVTFMPPDQPEPVEVELRPAQVSPGETLILFGRALRGTPTRLLLEREDWNEPRTVPDGWVTTLQSERLELVPAETIDGDALIPGIYSIQAEVVRRISLSDGGTEDVPLRSNRTPFTIIPWIDSVTEIGSSGRYRVVGGVYQHSELDAEDVECLIGDQKLTRITTGSAGAGEFRIHASDQIRFRFPPGLGSGRSLPLRLIVEGAESAPLWVEVP